MAQLEKIKLTAQIWDSDKDVDQFTAWLDTFSALVRATDHGAPLEDFISHKTGREVFTSTNVPTFLTSDPDFYVPADVRTSAGATMTVTTKDPNTGDPVPASAIYKPTGGTPIEERRARAAAAATGLTSRRLFAPDPPRTGMSQRVLKPSPHTYMDLPEESRALDGLLYNVFKMVVKGSKGAIITCVLFPSYVQAVCVLVEHMNISKYDRITKSIFALDRLVYNGDVHKFQVSAMEAIKEVRASKANITHLILTRLMKAFEGKSKTVQYKIAEVIISGI